MKKKIDKQNYLVERLDTKNFSTVEEKYYDFNKREIADF